MSHRGSIILENIEGVEINTIYNVQRGAYYIFFIRIDIYSGTTPTLHIPLLQDTQQWYDLVPRV